MVRELEGCRGVSKGHTLPIAFIVAYCAAFYLAHLARLAAWESETMGSPRLWRWPATLVPGWCWWSVLVSPFGLGSAIGGRDRPLEVDLGWYPPRSTAINDLETALHGTGVHEFIFNTSHTPDADYGTYNWCNMPHVRRTEYTRAPPEYELKYVEVIQRHHKRTPYASNAFPVEPYHWDCDDEGLYFYGAPFGGPDSGSGSDSDSDHGSDPGRRDDGEKKKRRPAPARGFWKGFISPLNPYVPAGWVGTCQFPQITAAGLDDSHAHGADLYGVYHGLLGFLPARGSPGWRDRVVYRVTQNVITSQVAGMLIAGTWGSVDDDDTPSSSSSSSSSCSSSTPLLVGAAGVDSLEPQYPCPAAAALFNAIRSPSGGGAWATHLAGAAALYAALDAASGVPPADPGFHASFDHYFDNLSARQCHAKPLPCRQSSAAITTTTTTTIADNSGGSGDGSGTAETVTGPPVCVDQALADSVYRLGQWEYSRVYRDAPGSLAASAASYGVYVAELAGHLRAAMAEGATPPLLYFHNVAHDGSVSRLLSILQIDVMVWPGMGSEVVFELYARRPSASSSSSSSSSRPTPSRDESTTTATTATSTTHEEGDSSPSGYYVRVLFGGRVLRSSNPSLGEMDMLPAETLLAYFDGLVGRDAGLVMGKCNGTISM